MTVDPVFFGLTGVGTQPTWFAVALHLGADRWSGIDLAYAALTRAVRSLIVGPVTEVPRVWLTPHVQLTPHGWLIHPGELPASDTQSGAALLFAFRDWADGMRLPGGLCAVSQADRVGDPAIVDLSVPAGVALLYRLAAERRSLLFISEVTAGDDGRGSMPYTQEYYAEVSACG